MIEAEFQRKQKTRVEFIDLFDAYDTIWRERIMQKFINVILCKKISKL